MEWKKKVLEESSGNPDHLIDGEGISADCIHEFEKPMIIVGCDVEALYLSLKISEVAKIVEEEVKLSKVVWQDLDYQEGARLIVLNRTEEWCRGSSLWRVLPRDGRMGQGRGQRDRPYGKRGDQEQFWRRNLKKKEEGGPIGLRATCAIARVTMNVWDRKWLTMVTKCGVNISNYMRYMDITWKGHNMTMEGCSCLD